jgi:hypothetical protein
LTLKKTPENAMPHEVALQASGAWSKLPERYNDGRSLFTAKLRFAEKEKEQGKAGAGRVTMSAQGPADDEFMSPASHAVSHQLRRISACEVVDRWQNNGNSDCEVRCTRLESPASRPAHSRGDAAQRWKSKAER